MRALILSGGSSLGAFQVGVINKIHSKCKNVNWRVFTGESIGAINGGFLSQYREHYVKNGIDELTNKWFSIKGNSDIYTQKIFGQLSLLWKTGFLCVKPLKKMIEENFDPQRVIDAKNKLIVGAVDLLSGEYVEVTEKNKNIKEYMLASAAMPFAFPAQEINNSIYTDGGVRRPISVSSAIKHECDHLDIVITAPLDYETRVSQLKKSQMKNGLDVGIRLIELMQEEILISTLKLIERCNSLNISGDPKYKFIHADIYAPRKKLTNDMLLTAFEPEQIREWFTHGLETEPVDIKQFLSSISLTKEIEE